jgi:hypothetical protein
MKQYEKMMTWQNTPQPRLFITPFQKRGVVEEIAVMRREQKKQFKFLIFSLKRPF